MRKLCLTRRLFGVATTAHTLWCRHGQLTPKEFLNDFSLSAENPDPRVFDTQAAVEFARAISGVFGEDVLKELGIKYCHRRREHHQQVFVGQGAALLRYLESHPGVVASLGIVELSRTEGA